MTQNEDLGDQVRREELVASFSRHAKLSNKYMLGVLFCCVVVAMNANPQDEVDFPFIGKIAAEYYFLVSISLISSLLILFSSTHLMALRIQEYLHLHFNGANDKDYIDLTVEPTLFRMAPIAWMIKNKNVFFINRDEGNKRWKRFELYIYLFLKTLVFFVVYLFPTIILVIATYQSGIYNFFISVNIFIRLPLIILSIMSVIAFSIVWKNSIIYTFLKVPKNTFK